MTTLTMIRITMMTRIMTMIRTMTILIIVEVDQIKAKETSVLTNGISVTQMAIQMNVIRVDDNLRYK